MPPRHFGLIKECSRLVLKVICVCGGVIDPDYKGEIQAILKNEGTNNFFINKHDWITQLLILLCVIGKVHNGGPPTILTVGDDGGFGSTNEIHAIRAKVG